MSEVRLIDANALKQDLELSKYIVPNDLNRLLNSEINRCIEAIDNAPTVAVNCKDCDGFSMPEKLYFNSDYHLMSWNEMPIGTIYYHIHLHDYCIKTGNQSYFSISKNHQSHRSKLLQGGGNYKNFIECSYRIQINGGDLSGK